jgi:hypothetical protein
MQSHTKATPEDDGEIERSLLTYLRGHPQAADTLDGIVEWWLPLQRYETARLRIERTLEKLVADGTLRRDLLQDGAVLYAFRDAAH